MRHEVVYTGPVIGPVIPSQVPMLEVVLIFGRQKLLVYLVMEIIFFRIDRHDQFHDGRETDPDEGLFRI